MTDSSEPLGSVPEDDYRPDTQTSEVPSPLYQLLLDSLDASDRRQVLSAMREHDDEVREAQALGLRASESL